MEVVTNIVSPKVSAAMNELLMAHYSDEDIKKAFFDMGPSKAPSPDGFHALCSQGVRTSESTPSFEDLKGAVIAAITKRMLGVLVLYKGEGREETGTVDPLGLEQISKMGSESSLRFFAKLFMYLNLLLLGPELTISAAAAPTNGCILNRKETEILKSIAQTFKVPPPSDFVSNPSDQDSGNTSEILCPNATKYSPGYLGFSCRGGDNSDSNGCYVKEFSWTNQDTIGPIPAVLANLTRLEILRLSGNKFNGEIPDSLGDMPSLYYLDLYDNQLTGQIPDSLGRLKTGAEVDL
ncbi:LRR domain containing protein [Parasponia andersonii]|uniref:LRR domain containing protein n=1 Tax=Parasponia andersonii TaxID=3476 RepID=A0A2P5A9J3_PARAD|nr:LRR domain containing protein [Parasponia andersonii]